jgi:hypothetical protein
MIVLETKKLPRRRGSLELVKWTGYQLSGSEWEISKE